MSLFEVKHSLDSVSMRVSNFVGKFTIRATDVQKYALSMHLNELQHKNSRFIGLKGSLKSLFIEIYQKMLSARNTG